MDSSNPINSKDQITVAEISEEHFQTQRQNYNYLQSLVADGRRNQAPTVSGKPIVDVSKEVLDGLKVVATGSNYTAKPLPEKGKIPRKIPLSSFPHRVFKAPVRDLNILKFILSREPSYALQCAQVVQTTGTCEGFLVRLEKWLSFQPVSVRAVCSKWGFKPKEIIRKRLPVGNIRTWNGDYWDLIGRVHTTKNSSAGPPYFKNKGEVWPDILQDLGKILDASSKGTLGRWLGENPAYLLSECKNKADRYKVSELLTKCRPYFSFSAPLQLLFSFLSQTFTEGLKLFSEDDNSWNGYGFSYAHGGCKSIMERMSRIKNGETTMIVYGDDVCLLQRDKSGMLWSVNADFSSMDASIDEDLVEEVIDYVLEVFEKQHGDNSFWREMAQLWKVAAVTGDFCVEGSQLYGKRGSLRTGVVGTTLFDTAKSVIAYELLIHAKIPLRNEALVSSFFKGVGLTLKPGTWNVTLVNECPEIGEIVMEDKWLGMYMRAVQGEKDVEPIPYVPHEDVAKLMTNPRYNTSAQLGRTASQRQLLDAAKGYTFLCTFPEHAQLWNAICDAHNNASSDILAQRVQSGNGKGEKPELVSLVGEDFEWPSSDGFPTVNFCVNVFLSKDNQIERGSSWIYWFPDLVRDLANFRKEIQRTVIAKVKEAPEGASWEESTRLEYARDQVALVGVTQIPEVMADPTALMNKVKINNSLTYKRPPSMEEKQAQIRTLIDPETLESFKLDWALMCFATFGDIFVYKTLREDGWFPHDKRIMKRTPANKVSKGDYGEYYYLVKKEFGVKKEPEDVITPPLPESREDFMIMIAKHLPPESQSMDPVSRVTGAFNNCGVPLKAQNEVIQQAPNSLVKHIVRTEEGTFYKTCVASSSKTARINLFTELLEELRNISRKTKIEKEKEKDKEKEIENANNKENYKPIPAPRSLPGTSRS